MATAKKPLLPTKQRKAVRTAAKAGSMINAGKASVTKVNKVIKKASTTGGQSAHDMSYKTLTNRGDGNGKGTPKPVRKALKK